MTRSLGPRGGGWFLIAAVLSGSAWWLVCRQLAPSLFRGYGGLDLLGAVVTGVVVSYASKRVYERLGWMNLLWLAPVSLYLAIALFSAVSFFSKLVVIGPSVVGESWSPSSGTIVHWEGPVHLLGLIFGLWWGVTVSYYAAYLFPLAFLNHLLLRRLARATAR